MEDNTVKKTVHIKVKNQKGLDGSFPWVPGSVPIDGTMYKIGKNSFPMTNVSMVDGSSGNEETLSGAFVISGVGDDYGNVMFGGTFVSPSSKGNGNVNWDGHHLPRDTGGSDPWTSDTTTPIPYKSHAKARGQTP